MCFIVPSKSIAAGPGDLDLDFCRARFVEIAAPYSSNTPGAHFPALSDDEFEIIARLIASGDPKAELVLLKAYMGRLERIANRFAQRHADLGADEGEIFGRLLDVPIRTIQRRGTEDVESYVQYVNGAIRMELRTIFREMTTQSRVGQMANEDGTRRIFSDLRLDQAVTNSGEEGERALIDTVAHKGADPLAILTANSELDKILRTKDEVIELTTSVVSDIPSAKAESALAILFDRRVGGTGSRISEQEARVIGERLDLTHQEIRTLDTHLYAAMRSKQLNGRAYTIYDEAQMLGEIPTITNNRTALFYSEVLGIKIDEIGMSIDEAKALVTEAISQVLGQHNVYYGQDLKIVLMNLVLHRHTQADAARIAVAQANDLAVGNVKTMARLLRTELKEKYAELLRLRQAGSEKPALDFQAEVILGRIEMGPPPVNGGQLVLDAAEDFAGLLNDMDRFILEHRILRRDWLHPDIAQWFQTATSGISIREEIIRRDLRSHLIGLGYPNQGVDEKMANLFSASRTERNAASIETPSLIEQTNMFEALAPELADRAMSGAERDRVMQELWLAVQIAIRREPAAERGRSIAVLRQTILNQVPHGASDELAQAIGFNTRTLRNSYRRGLVSRIQTVLVDIRENGLSLENVDYVMFLRKQNETVTAAAVENMALRMPAFLESLSPVERIIAIHRLLRADWQRPRIMEASGLSEREITAMEAELAAKILAIRGSRAEAAEAVQLRIPRQGTRRNNVNKPDKIESLRNEFDAIADMGIDPGDLRAIGENLLPDFKIADISPQDEIALLLTVQELIRRTETQNKGLYQHIFTNNFFASGMVGSIPDLARDAGTSPRN